MDNEILTLAADLRAGFHAALSYVADPDDLQEDDPDYPELSEDDISERLHKAHRAADRLTQIERERAGQCTLFGQYHIPLTIGDLLYQLSQGVPCETTLRSLPYVLDHIDRTVPITIEVRDRKAYLTPETVPA